MQFVVDLFDFLINRPFLLLVAMSLPLLFMATVRKCFPTQRLLWIVAIPTFVSFAIIQVPAVGWYVLFLDLALIIVASLDGLTIVGKTHFSATRTVNRIASLGKKLHCELVISNRSKHKCLVRIKDDVPSEFVAELEEFAHKFDPMSRYSIEYSMVCIERGRFEFEFVYLRVTSWLGLWNSFYSLSLVDEINVYPDMQQISEYDLLARTNRLNLMGLRRNRRIGQDNEFERLRDYTQDDNYKFIDWRATGRRQKLTVRDFQSNQSQRIMFLVDCGRMMTGESGGIKMLDHAFNAILMLSYVALRQGDSVGLVCFSDKIHNYTPAKTGVNQINRLLHASFDQHARFVESRYDKAVLYLRANCRKRSLVVLVTNIVDEINAHQVQQYLGMMQKQHLPLGILLRDPKLFQSIDEYDGGEDGLFAAAAAARIANWRHQVIVDMTHQGVLSLDVFPDQLTAALVNQYLEIKAKHLL